MADYVATQTVALDDQASSNAKAITDALNSMADAADQVNTSVTRAGPSVQTLAKRFDEATSLTAALDKAQRSLATGSATASAGLAAGTITQQQYNAIVDGLTGKVTSAKSALAQLTGGANDNASALQKAAGGSLAAAAAADTAAEAHAGFYREIVILGHEVVSGNFSRIPGSLMVLAERSGSLQPIMEGVVNLFTTFGGVAILGTAAAVAGLVAMAVSAEDASLKLAAVQNQLRATRADYETLAPTVVSGAQQFSVTSGVSGSDSLAAAQTLAAQPLFGGQSGDLQTELALSQNLAAVWGTTLPDAAKKLASALADPMAAAQSLANEGFPSMTEATLRTIQTFQQQGNYIAADKTLLDAYGQTVNGAAQNLTPLGQAIRDLGTEFGSTETTIGGVARGIGSAIVAGLAGAIEAVATLAHGVNQLGAIAVQTPLQTLTPAYQSPVDRLNAAMAAASGSPANAAPGAGTGPVGVGLAQQNAQDAQTAAQNQKVLQDADKASAATEAARTLALQNQNVELQSAITLAQQAGQSTSAYTEQIQKNNEEITKLAEADHDHSNELMKAVTETNIAAANNEALTTAYNQGYAAVQQVTAGTEAQSKAIQIYGQYVGTHQQQIDALTAAYERQLSTAGDLKLAQDNLNDQDTLQYLQAETDSLGMDSDARNVMLAGLKAEQQARAANGGTLTAEGQQYIANAEAIEQATDAYQHQQQAISDLSNMATGAFDQVGQAIANAFVGGSGQAVNFGNVVRSVLGSVLEQVAKLAIVNPLLNDLVGGETRDTLASDLAAVGAFGSTGSSSSASGTGLLGELGSFGNLFGLTGSNGLLTDLGLTGSNGLFSSVGGLLSTGLWTDSAASANIAASALYGGTAAGAEVLPSVTVGGLLGGAGLGFGAGSLLNSVLGGNQENGDIGSGVGAAAGSAIGSIVPGIGTLIGGLVGGLIGGAGGGLLGGKEHHGWNIQLGTDSNGMLQVTGSGADKTDITQQLQTVEQQLTTLDSLMASIGVSTVGSYVLGANNAGPATPSDVNGLFGALQFTSSDSTVAAALAGRSFSDSTDLQNFVTLVGTTIPQLTANSGSLQQSIDSLNNSFDAAIQQAQSFGLSTDALTAAQAQQTAQLQQQADQQTSATESGFVDSYLTTEYGSQGGSLPTFDASADQQRNQLTQQLVQVYGQAYETTSDYTRIMGELNDALSAQRDALVLQNQFDQDNIDLSVETIQANKVAATGDTQEADLMNFQISAQQQRLQLEQQLISVYGQAVIGTAGYNTIMDTLNDTLNAQYQQLVNQPTEDAAQPAASAVSSLDSYVQSLLTGSSNPGGPLASFSAAQDLWNNISTGALAGNADDIQQLQSAASTFLSNAQTVYGSGQSYVAAFNEAVGVLQQFSNMASSQLTQAFIAQNTETQTAALTAAMADITTNIQKLITVTQQKSAQPARIS